MTSFTNVPPSQIYGDLLTTTNSGQGLSNVLNPLQDALGNSCTVQIANNAINFSRTGGNTFQLDGVALTATALNINNICNGNPVFPGTGGLSLPAGNTGQRPISPSLGTIRYNTSSNEFELFGFSSQWYRVMYDHGALTTNVALSNILLPVEDASGNSCPMELSTNAVNFIRTGGNTFQLDGIPLLTPADTINRVLPISTVASCRFSEYSSALQLPQGNTALRPVLNIIGSIRFNTQTNNFEGYDGTSWKVFTIV